MPVTHPESRTCCTAEPMHRRWPRSPSRLAPSGDGIDNPPELASSVGALMTAARELADVVIIDTPALLSVSAASELLPAADVAVIVARSARTTREAAIRVHERLEFLGAPVLGIVLVGPQIPSVSREYSGYSRPPGGWRKRRKIMRKRGIQIGARAETLAPTKGTVPTGSPRSIQPGRGAAITVDPAPARAPRGTEGPETDIREPAPDAGISQRHDPDVPEYVAPVASVDDLSPRPRWRRRESRRDE